MKPMEAAAGPVAAFAEGVRHWFLYRDTSETLTKLSRRELSDIGVEESADEYAWRFASEKSRR